MNATTVNQSQNRRTKPRHKVIPFSFERQVVASSLAVGSQQKNIHALIEVDITEPRRLMREHKQRTGENLSLTAYVVTCLGHAVAAHPHLNSFRKGRRLILLENVSIGTLVEREINGELVPENVGIRSVQAKSYRQVHDEIRAIQQRPSASMGELSGSGWVRFIPRFLFKTFVRLASRSLTMNDRYGVVAVTAVGMFGNPSLSLIPIVGGATVGLAVGGIEPKPAIVDGQLVAREHLHITATFNHEIVDGAPAARFLKHFTQLVESGELLSQSLSAEG